MGEGLVVEIVRTLERQGIPRDAYQLHNYVDVESLERVIETAPADAEFHLTVERIPLTIASDGVRIRRDDESQRGGAPGEDWANRTTSPSSKDDIYQWTIDFVTEHLPAERVIIAEANDTHLVPVTTSDGVAVDTKSVEPIAASIPGHVYDTGQSCNIPDLQDVRGSTTAPQDQLDARPRSFIAAPITDIGAISASSSTPSAFTDAHEETLLAVGNLIGNILHGEQFSAGLQNEHVLKQITDILSHDLANKVTTAKGFLELAEQTQDPEYIVKAKDGISGIESMADMLVTLGRTGDPIETYTEIELGEQAKEVFRDLNGGELRVVESGIVLADPACLRRILHNVFQNAIDHASADVTVDVGLLDDGFYVEDDGPGFPADLIDDTFEPAVSSRGGHHGIGLTIVKRLAEAHGWTVTNSSSTSSGARIEFTSILVLESE